MWQKLSPILHLLLVEEQSQQLLLIHQALSGSNTSACPHIGFRSSGTLARTSRPVRACARSNVPLSQSFSCGPSYISLLCLTCKWAKCTHAGALPQCVPNPLAAFSLFRDYPVFKRHRHFSLYSTPLRASWLVRPPANNPVSHPHYHLNVSSDMTTDSNHLCLRLCMHVCGSVYVASACNVCECTHEYVF